MSNGETIWRRVFGLDVRSLAVLRIGLGLVLLGNLCDLTPDIGAFFSDEGLLPRTARMQLNASEAATAPPHWCSLHMLSGATWCQELLIGAAIVLSGCVVLGYRNHRDQICAEFDRLADLPAEACIAGYYGEGVDKVTLRKTM